MRKHSSLPCCGCCDLTLATRWIGFFGLALSTALTTVLISDKRAHNFDHGRTIAAALGLDWQHFHSTANATRAADHDGKLISVILVFYSTVYLVTNMVLIFASITENRWCTLPWIGSEIFSCLSKIIAMLHHSLYQHRHFTTLFYVGSVLYVVIGFWWIIVVYCAQKSWSFSGEVSLESPLKDGITLSRMERVDDFTFNSDARFSYFPTHTLSLDVDSPVYIPNHHYGQI